MSRLLDPRGRPRDICYTSSLRVPTILHDRLWTGDGCNEREVYAHTLSYQTGQGIVARLLRGALTDPGDPLFGAALWQEGVRQDCRRCHCETLRWHRRQWFCGQRCRRLWLLSHPQDVAAGAVLVGAIATARAVAERLPVRAGGPATAASPPGRPPR